MSVGSFTIGGVTYDIVPRTKPVPPPVTPPATVVPADTNQVTVGGVALPVDAVNPVAGPPFGGRGKDQLVVFTNPAVTVTPTNQFGVEVVIQGGVVASVNDRQATGSTTGTAVPANAAALSAHGTARDALLAAAKAGARVSFAKVDRPAPAPGPVTPPVGSGGKTLAMYVMDGVGHVGQVPSNVTQIRVAFLQGTSLTEWGGDTPAQTAAALTQWKAARPGRQILISVGGSGGSVSLPGLVQAFKDIESKAPSIPVDGIDWDLEGGSYEVAQIVAISKALAAGRESTWVTSFVPPGGPPVDTALAAARQCQDAGLRVLCGSQLYDAEVPLSAALGVLQREVAVLGAQSVAVGMMVASDPKHWTVDQCESNMTAIVARWPGVSCYLWESSRAGTADWAARMGAVLGL